MGLAEHELKPIVDAWRAAHPPIVQLWVDVEESAIAAIVSRLARCRNARGRQSRASDRDACA